MGKIIDMLKDHKDGFIAFEYFPPRTAEGVANLHKRFLRMSSQGESLRRWGRRGVALRAGAMPEIRFRSALGFVVGR